MYINGLPKSMADPSGFLDRLLDDDPELRGQRLWVMFAISVVLVAAMNAYAMLRAPDQVDIADMIEHNNEVVAIEGIVISWVKDPYSQGEQRADIIIEDDTGVAELRWYRYGEIPMLGTKVTAIGDVIEYEGRLWLQALGAGALTWSEDDVPDAPITGVSTIAANPAAFDGKSVTINGYLSKAVDPGASFTALYLGDHPIYGSSEHQMRMIIHSAPGQWLESGQKVEVTAVLQYEQRELRWALHVEGPEVRIVRSHTPLPTVIGWETIETWSFSSGNLVSLVGQIDGDEIIGPDGNHACLANAGDLTAHQGEDVTFRGRLLWSSTYGGWCIDASGESDGADLIDVTDAENLLLELARNPHDTLNDSENSTHYLISAFAYGAKEMSSDGDTSIILADGIYPNILTKLDAFVPVGIHTGWLEDGQALVLNVTASWNSASAEIQLTVHAMTLTADSPAATFFDLNDGAPEWYALDKMTRITGNFVQIDGELYLQKEGGQARILIDVAGGSIGTDSIHQNLTLEWTGRLSEIPDDVDLSHHYILLDADVTDTDGDGLSDDAEDALGYDKWDEDSDDNGIGDRQEVENQE
jgi:hypothetical protein